MPLKNDILIGAGFLAAWSGLCAPAQAQDTDAAPESVVVTGTRLGQSGLNTPTPVIAVSAEDLAASAPSNIADALNNLPSMVQSGGQQSNAGSTSVGKNLLNLRGLGQTRTLVLLDGIRFPATQNTNTVDINVLPQSLVKRVDIVTGGASASYGSDAVAGAVNFVLDDTFEGIGGQLSSGVSEYGDNLEVHGALTGGAALFAGRMHVVGSLDYIDNFGAAGNSRPFRTTDANAIAAPGNPLFLNFVPNAHTVGSFGGYTVSAAAAASVPAASRAANQAALSNLQFNNSGSLVPYDAGTLNDGAFQNGGDGINTAVLQDVSRPLRRRTAFLRDEFIITEGLTFFIEGLYGHSDAEQNDAEFAVGANAPVIHSDNPYLSPATAAQFATLLGATAPGATTNLGGTLTVSKYFPYDPSGATPNSFEYKYNDRATSQVLIGGFNGTFGKFAWGLSGTYGYTRDYSSATNALNLVNLALAADATTNPATGQIVCRATLPSPGNGCVPINIFGTGNVTASAISYITDNNPVVQDSLTGGAEFHITGPLFALPAGMVVGALGGEFRRQRDAVISGPNDVAKVYQLGTLLPWQGGYDVTEGFGEVGVPLLADRPLVRNLDADLAARITNYSTGAVAVTWKAGLVWRLDEAFSLRTTVSRDIRAPNPSDLFSGGTQGTSNVTDPFNNNVTDRGIKMTQIGNPALAPERGTTLTGGVTYLPDWIPGLGLTVDYYDIRVAGIIATPTVQNEINFCFQGNTIFCPLIQRNGAGAITAVTVKNQNLNSERTDGVDLEATYAVPAGDWFSWWRGDLSVHTLTNYLGINTLIVPGSPTIQEAGASIYTLPHLRNETQFTYDIDQWSTFLQLRYIGPGLWNNQLGNPAFVPVQTSNFNHIGAASYFDFQETYRLDPHLNLYVNIQNIFDLQPQFAFSNSNYATTTNEGLYDQIGRMFRVGIRLKY